MPAAVAAVEVLGIVVEQDQICRKHRHTEKTALEPGSGSIEPELAAGYRKELELAELVEQPLECFEQAAELEQQVSHIVTVAVAEVPPLQQELR